MSGSGARARHPHDPRTIAGGRVGALMIGMAVVVWWPSFTLGAWGTLFFDQVLALWAAATAAFVFVLVERRPAGIRLLRAFLLLLPSAWLFLLLLTPSPPGPDDVLVTVIGIVAVVAVFIGLPFTVWVLARIVWPDLGAHAPRRLRLLTIAVVVGVAISSYVLGLNESRFLTCEDFTISGNSQPPGCTPAGG